jgi:hypothetical protein
MFGWFAPKCPLDTWEKTWTERRMRWLADRFGAERLLQTRVVLPTDFTLPFGRDDKSLRRLFDRVCDCMGVSPEKVVLQFVDDEDPLIDGAAGLYQQRRRSIISVRRSQLDDPERLLATFSHELAHELLLGGGLLDRDVSDHEWVTDLLPVFLGIGIFLANGTIRDWSTSSGTTSWSWMSRQGYLPSRMFGYAFALFAFVRGETDPPWAHHLRLDASAALHAGLRFLRKTGDSLFTPDTIHDKLQPLTPAAALDRLRTGTPTFRLATLWDIRDESLTDPEVLAAVRACLDDRDPHIVAEAAHTLATFGPAAEESVPRLVDLLWHGSSKIKIGVAEALGAIGSRPANVVPELTALLEAEEDLKVVGAAAGALRCFGAAAASAVPLLLNALKPALLATDGECARCLLAALRAASDDPRRQLQNHFTDPELLRLALDAFQRYER